MNIMQIMKQAQNVQAKLKESQKQLADMELMGEAGSGAVKIICDGQGKFKSIKLDSEALSISSENAEELEDLISVAMKQASDKASKEMESKMKAATGGLNIPGLNF
ncbi:MAG: YbaB/EbfC family nucleoid-associated protein [Brachyspira sp.]|nr:YbaB/EbfC family nucleoid-associated protein [Brachyspira sp.]